MKTRRLSEQFVFSIYLQNILIKGSEPLKITRNLNKNNAMK